MTKQAKKAPLKIGQTVWVWQEASLLATRRTVYHQYGRRVRLTHSGDPYGYEIDDTAKCHHTKEAALRYGIALMEKQLAALKAQLAKVKK